MTSPFPGAQQTDPAAEAGRLADDRAHGYTKVLHIGDVIRVYGAAGEVFTGRIADVERLTMAGRFRVACQPLSGGQDG